jgi:hypothetical protein
MPWLEARCKGHAVAEALNDTKSSLETQWLRTKEKVVLSDFGRADRGLWVPEGNLAGFVGVHF